ncbi:alpha/beta hydrolase [Aquamicrobium segne]|uniref:Palmitoyl-protein thioesterase ABHD10, mitochondrial n=1 Tax=Aquamicrobium segne TaxID=469547 RepID=A0ABW0H1E7_9HYPH
MIASQVEYLDVDGIQIAVRRQEGDAPGVMWLGGYKSDMLGSKAEALAQWSASQGRAFVRHDYSGHGESGGKFEDGTISKWLRESLAVFARHTRGNQILVGSSMGGWVALRMVQELLKAGESRVKGVVLIAPAPDFTAELVEPALTQQQHEELAAQGYFQIPSDYVNEPYIYTRALIEDGRDNLVMTGLLDTHCPVHILQGMQDESVPHTHALKLVSLLPADDVTLSMIPDGDHRLSRQQDLDLLIATLSGMTAQASQ